MKKLYFGAVLSVALLLTGCSGSAPQGNSNVPQASGGNQVAQAPQDFVPAKTDVGACISGCAVLDGSGMITKEFCEDSCWAAKAEEEKDITICDEKVRQDNAMVQSACRMNVAEATGETKYCDTIGDSKDDIFRGSCYGEIAKMKQDPTICEAISGTFLYGSCIEEAGGVAGAEE